MFKTYGTCRVYRTESGQYHEPLVCTALTPEDAQRIALALNRAPHSDAVLQAADALVGSAMGVTSNTTLVGTRQLDALAAAVSFSG